VKVVGVIGGMGPAATVEFQQRLLAATPAKRDQDHLRVIVDNNPTLPNRNDAIAGRGPSPAPLLAAMARGLETAGADFLVMPCNTAHAFEGEIRSAVTIPFLSLIGEAANAAALDAPGGPIGVLAADGCRAAGLYERALADRELNAVVLDEAEQSRLMSVIYAVKAGDVSEPVRAEARALAGSLLARGARAVISGCTELALVIGEADLDAPLIDSTDVLVARTLAFARGDLVSGKDMP